MEQPRPQEELFDYTATPEIDESYDDVDRGDLIEGNKTYNVGGKNLSGVELAQMISDVDKSAKLEDELVTLRTEMARMQGAMEAQVNSVPEVEEVSQEPEPLELVETLRRFQEDGRSVSDMDSLIEILQANNNDWQKKFDNAFTDPQYTEGVVNHHINRLGEAHISEQAKETALVGNFNSYIENEAKDRDVDVEIIRQKYRPILEKMLRANLHLQVETPEDAANLITNELDWHSGYQKDLQNIETNATTAQTERRSAASTRRGYATPKPTKRDNGVVRYPTEDEARDRAQKVYRSKGTVIG